MLTKPQLTVLLVSFFHPFHLLVLLPPFVILMHFADNKTLLLYSIVTPRWVVRPDQDAGPIPSEGPCD